MICTFMHFSVHCSSVFPGSNMVKTSTTATAFLKYSQNIDDRTVMMISHKVSGI